MRLYLLTHPSIVLLIQGTKSAEYMDCVPIGQPENGNMAFRLPYILALHQ